MFEPPMRRRRVHDLVFSAGRDPARWLLWAVADAQQHDDFGAECFFVELDCFFAAAVKIQVGFDWHGFSPDRKISVSVKCLISKSS